MRICHIGFNFFPGQGLTIFYEFARHQARAGLEVTAIAPGRPGEAAQECIDGVRVERIPLRSIGRFSGDRLRFVRAAAQRVAAGGYDLVHVYAFVGAGLLPLFGRTAPARWLYDCQTSAIKPPLLGLQNRLIRLEARSFDAVSVLSEGIRDIVFGPRFAADAIVPLGADLDFFRPQPPAAGLRASLGLAPDDMVLAYCGSLDHDRHLHRLIDAFALVARARADARLLLIGRGSALDELRARAAAAGLAGRVVCTGHVAYAEVPRHLAGADVALAYVACTPCFEHQPPTKTVEYLAQGLPVVATATAGNRCFVTDDRNGVVCGDSPEAFAAAVLALLDDRPRRLRLAAAARESVREFAWEHIVGTQVIPLYERLLGRKRHHDHSAKAT